MRKNNLFASGDHRTTYYTMIYILGYCKVFLLAHYVESVFYDSLNKIFFDFANTCFLSVNSFFLSSSNHPITIAMSDYTNSKTMIETHGLSKYYGDFIAVEDLSFSIKEGEVVAFLGPNGAGKSTTMKMLTGYLAPSAGNCIGLRYGSCREQG